MATNTTMSRFAPKPTGVRDPRDAQKRNSIFWNPPRFLYFGGVQQPWSQAGDKNPGVLIGGSGTMMASNGQWATGPISDRGKGRG